MQTFDRMGIHLEQCESCRGIFLDRGELEQIISAEQRHYGAPAAPGPSGTAGAPPPVQPYRDSPAPYSGGGGHHPGGYQDSPRPYSGGYQDSPRPYGQRRRKKSFLEQLFD
ncbi:zf-TFIIB domain-containing protein [Streptomonospora salina]